MGYPQGCENLIEIRLGISPLPVGQFRRFAISETDGRLVFANVRNAENRAKVFRHEN